MTQSEDSDKINLFAKYEGIDYSNVSENNGKDTHYISLLDDILSFLADLEEYVMAQAGIKNLSTSVECQFYAKEQELSDREIIIYNEIDNLRKKIEESDTISGLFNFFSTN